MKNFTYKGYDVEIDIEEDTSIFNPREWAELGTIVVHNGKNSWIGDESVYMRSFDDFKEYLTDEKDLSINDVIYLPVYVYSHGSTSVNTTGYSCPWDSAQIGYIFTSKEQVRKKYNKKRINKKIENEVLELLDDEIKNLDDYFNTTHYCGYFTGNDEIAEYSYASCVDELESDIKQQIDRIVASNTADFNIEYAI